MRRRGTFLVIAGLVLVLGVANHTIWKKEVTRAHGREVLLELRPVDPRSLMQGDFMALRYAENVFPQREQNGSIPDAGTMVLALDENYVGTFLRIDDQSPLAQNEVRLQFRTISRTGEFGIGAESFFFQEGHGDVYANASFGVIRVDESGESVLVGLADENHDLIRPPSDPEE